MENNCTVNSYFNQITKTKAKTRKQKEIEICKMALNIRMQLVLFEINAYLHSI